MNLRSGLQAKCAQLLLPELWPDVERQTESFADTVEPGQVRVEHFSL